MGLLSVIDRMIDAVCMAVHGKYIEYLEMVDE